jgi:hypothetical protein
MQNLLCQVTITAHLLLKLGKTMSFLSDVFGNGDRTPPPSAAAAATAASYAVVPTNTSHLQAAALAAQVAASRAAAAQPQMGNGAANPPVVVNQSPGNIIVLQQAPHVPATNTDVALAAISGGRDTLAMLGALPAILKEMGAVTQNVALAAGSVERIITPLNNLLLTAGPLLGVTPSLPQLTPPPTQPAATTAARSIPPTARNVNTDQKHPEGAGRGPAPAASGAAPQNAGGMSLENLIGGFFSKIGQKIFGSVTTAAISPLLWTLKSMLGSLNPNSARERQVLTNIIRELEKLDQPGQTLEMAMDSIKKHLAGQDIMVGDFLVWKETDLDSIEAATDILERIEPLLAAYRANLKEAGVALKEIRETLGSHSAAHKDLRVAPEASLLTGIQRILDDARAPTHPGSEAPTKPQIVEHIRNYLGVRRSEVSHYALRVVKHAPPPLAQGQDVDKEIDAQRKIFDENTSRFAAFKGVENLFGLEVDDNLYFEAMQAAREKPTEAAVILRQKFYEKINKSTMNGLKKVLAKICYRFLCWVMPFFVSSASAKVTAMMKEYIEANKKDQYAGFGSTLINNITRYLGILRGSYERIAADKTPTGNLKEMLTRELDRKECNKGLTPAEIYKKISETGIDQFAPRWEPANAVWSRLESLRISQKSALRFLNYAIAPITYIISAPICLLLWVTQTITNFISHRIYNVLMKKTGVVGSVVNTGVNAISRNGYTHALNKVLIERLSKLLKKMVEPSTGGGAIKQSLPQKAEFTALIKQLLDVLELSKCKTREEVAKLLNNPSLLQQGRKLADDLVIRDSVEIAFGLILAMWNSISEEGELKSQLLHFFTTVNDSYKVGKVMSSQQHQKEYQEVENLRNELADQVINVAIQQAVDDKLTFNLDRNQIAYETFVEEMRTDVAKFKTDMTRAFTPLAEKRSHVDHAKAFDALLAVYESSPGYPPGFLETRNGRTTAIRLSDLHTVTKTKLTATESSLLEKLEHHGMQAILKSLGEYYSSSKRAALQDEEFSKLVKLTAALPGERRMGNFQKCETDLTASLQQLTHLDLTDTVKAMISHTQTLQQAYRDIHIAAMTRECIEAKKALEQKPKEQNLKTALQTKVNALITVVPTARAHLSTLANTPAATWEKHPDSAKLLALSSDADKKIAPAVTAITTIQTKTQSENAEKLRHNTLAIAEKQKDLAVALNKVTTWAETLKIDPPLSLPLPGQLQFKEFVIRGARHEAKRRVEGLVEFISEPHTYRYGVFHHQLFIPFLDKYGKLPATKA